MMMNGMKLESRGKERVYFYGEWMKRTVYMIPNEWRFFVKVGGVFTEVYHKSCWFSTEDDGRYER